MSLKFLKPIAYSYKVIKDLDIYHYGDYIHLSLKEATFVLIPSDAYDLGSDISLYVNNSNHPVFSSGLTGEVFNDTFTIKYDNRDVFRINLDTETELGPVKEEVILNEKTVLDLANGLRQMASSHPKFSQPKEV